MLYLKSTLSYESRQLYQENISTTLTTNCAFNMTKQNTKLHNQQMLKHSTAEYINRNLGLFQKHSIEFTKHFDHLF